MRSLLSFILLVATYLPLSTSAQTRTYSVDVSDRAHVPLYDCDIFSNNRDRSRCQDLARGENVRWDNDGYAINCYDLSRSRRDSCLTLAENIFYDNSRIDCRMTRRDRDSQRQCEIVKASYYDGRFQERGVTRSTTTVVRRNGNTYTGTTTCDVNGYDRALENWRMRKEEQRKKGQTRAAVGIATTIGGIILSGSSDRGTRDLGTGLAIGGVLLTSWGMVEMADADASYPHLDPYCKTNWVQETRMVVVERQECMTTRYSERGRYSSRYYYETTCSNKRYVTFEEFSPWERGREVNYYYRY